MREVFLFTLGFGPQVILGLLWKEAHPMERFAVGFGITIVLYAITSLTVKK